MELNKENIIQIHSYKHDKKIHRVWDNVMVLDKKDEMLVVGNFKTRVIEANGRSWSTKEPAICFFYQNEWHNIIAMLKYSGINYYCNISSPYVYDGEAIKYIDYDLDVRVNPDFTYTILDCDEYKKHSKKMQYSDDIKLIIDDSLKRLITKIENREGPFDHKLIEEYYKTYIQYNKSLRKYAYKKESMR